MDVRWLRWLPLLVGINGASQSFHRPTSSSALTEFVRARHFVRVNGFHVAAENRWPDRGLLGSAAPATPFGELNSVLAINVLAAERSSSRSKPAVHLVHLLQC